MAWNLLRRSSWPETFRDPCLYFLGTGIIGTCHHVSSLLFWRQCCFFLSKCLLLSSRLCASVTHSVCLLWREVRWGCGEDVKAHPEALAPHLPLLHFLPGVCLLWISSWVEHLRQLKLSADVWPASLCWVCIMTPAVVFPVPKEHCIF